MSVNQTSRQLVKRLCEATEEYGVAIKENELGTTLIDAGVEAKGGFLAGRMITEICLGGYGRADIFYKRYNGLELPSILVHTDHPAIATLGSQFAGWRIKVGKYFAMGSGPARALAQKPKELYEKIGYKDKANSAVLVLETDKYPPNEVITYISDECSIQPEKLFLILVPTTTIAGSTQISGRVVETGIHKLEKLGLDPKWVTHACGYAPIAPVHPRFAEAMGRTNDAILYTGVVHCIVNHTSDETLRMLAEKAPSSASESHGQPFIEIFKKANYDFYQIDSNLFAPAVLIVSNAETGSTFKGGEINLQIFKRSIGI
ncbi:MAG: methenyltetrahydromethanopterin cyclohydrolase [Candidatus Bathyarchaeota archaeon]|nr:MAG: methenyltetrahydromethanopterin cyclohydrolase [Candidatus Bathyarchaeota archaeon]